MMRLSKTKQLSLLAISLALATSSYAGERQKWEEVPEAVRNTILANGGSKDGRLDKEGEKVDGKVLYEAVGKDKKGNDVDLQITEDGKLVGAKNDDAADAAKEKAAAAKKARKGKYTFSHPRDITNPYLPLGTLKQDILEGKEGKSTVRIERTAKPEIHKSFKVGKQIIDSLAVEDREIANGELEEVAMDYFAQADDGTVLYLGENVDEYKDGKIVSHSGTWFLGKDTKKPGVIFPGSTEVGTKFKSEDVNKEIHEDDYIISNSETVTTPAGTYKDCIKVKEVLADGAIEFKYYAKGVGVVREQPAEGDVLLKTHDTLKSEK